MSKSYKLLTTIRPGDPVGFSGRSRMGRWINIFTLGMPGRGLSHIAICGRHPHTDELVLYESTTDCNRPCLLAGQLVQGVQCQPLAERVGGYKGNVFVFSLHRPLTNGESRELTAFCVADCERHIEYDMSGAIRSRQLGFGWAARWVLPKEEDLNTQFCSELVAARLRDLGRMEIENASEWAPNPLSHEFLRQEVTYKRQRVRFRLTGEKL